MPRRAMALLTESMFYVLMALCRRPMCGAAAAAEIERLTGGRLRLGPATLYTILAKFAEAKYIEEMEAEGCRRTYRITPAGRRAYEAERERLRRCLADAEAAERREGAE